MEKTTQIPLSTVSKFQEAKKEVKALYEDLKAKDNSTRISIVYTSYAIDKNFKNWNSLAAILKQEDYKNGVCWNCHDFVPTSSRYKCQECGKGK